MNGVENAAYGVPAVQSRGRQRIRTPREQGVPDTPEAREHARRAVQIREWLNEMGISPEVVAPTRDGKGHVRLNFDQVETLLFEDEEEN